MQVNSNYQPSFKAINPTQAAEKAIKQRISAQKAEALLKELPKMCPGFDVELSTTSFESVRLDAMVNLNGCFQRYIEEPIWSSVFCSPKRFAKNIVKVVQQDVIPRMSEKSRAELKNAIDKTV